jgi:hypothetical protein
VPALATAAGAGDPIPEQETAIRKPAIVLSHNEVQQAIALFRARGGLIRKLPNEVAPPDARVHPARERSFVPASLATLARSGAA